MSWINSFFSVSWIGEFSLLLTWIASVYAIGSSMYGAKKNQPTFIHSARYATYACAALLSIASLLVLYSLLSNDFSLKYVYSNSSVGMPWYYKLTAYWGGLDGSILFWAWLLSLFSALAIHQNKEKHQDLIPWIIAILMGILFFFVLLLIFYKPPFALFLQQVPLEGKGLSPLLQDPYMAIHPPSLYIGYVSASIPFSFGLAALICGNQDQSWVKSVRRWMIFCFYFLSQGLILGSLWSYHVLGWGGYWVWDPVENAGLFPWFTATAFLHSILIEERKGIMRVWNLLLVIITFLLTLVGTFLTRSGIVQSIHAFGKDPELTALFLTFISFWAVVGFGFLIHRLPLLRAQGQIESLLSREFAFLLNNWVLLSLAFFLLIATLAPTLAEALFRERIQIDPPFYHRWTSAFGLLLLVLVSMGPLLAWKKMSVRRFLRRAFIPMTVGFLTCLVLAIFVPASRTKSAFLHTGIQIPVSLFCFSFCAMALTSIFQEFYQGIQARRRIEAVGFLTALLGIVIKSPKKYGGYVIHLGIVLMFFGFAGQPFERNIERLIEKPGQEVTLGRYTLRYEGYKEAFDTNKERIEETRFFVFENGKLQGEMKPARWIYRQRADEPARTIVQIRSSFQDDLYVTLQKYEPKTGLVSIKVQINLLVTWVWIGFSFLIFGVCITLLPERMKRLRSISPVFALPLVLMLTSFANAQSINPQEPQNEQHAHVDHGENFPQPVQSELEQEIRKQLVCLCGSCPRLPLSDCACDHAIHEQKLIADLIKQGKTKEEIFAYFVQKHGSEKVFRFPKDQGTYRLIWAVPVIFILLALAFLFYRRLWQKNTLSPHPQQQITPSLSEEEEKKYQALLDKDLKVEEEDE